MSRQNLTISLDRELVQKLRVIAAQRSMSISGLLAQELMDIVERSERFEHARRSALAALDADMHLGGLPASREELHDRAALR